MHSNVTENERSGNTMFERTQQESRVTVPAEGQICIPARISFAIFGAMAMGITYGHKACMSVALVSMLNYTAIQEFDEENERILNRDDGPFTWDGQQRSWILASYFIGYISCQFLGSHFAQYSAKWVIIFTVAINGMCCVFTPLCSFWHWSSVVALRALQGIGGSASMPAMHVMLAKWSPVLERSRMSSLVYSGSVMGSILSVSLTGLIAHNWSWQLVFYSFGILSLDWLFLWVILVQDSPDLQPYISEEERNKITVSLQSSPKKYRYKFPWKKAFTSGPFLSLALAHFCTNCGWYMILIELPFYMKSVLKFQLSENALFASIPFLTMYIFSNIIGLVLDALISKNKMSITMARKTATLIALLGQALFFGILCVKPLGTNKYIGVLLVTLATTATGGIFSGVLLNHLDIASNHAGTLMALTNTFASIPAIVIPFIVNALTKENKSFEAWRNAFLLVVGFLILGASIYPVFGSAEEQPWNQDGKIEN